MLADKCEKVQTKVLDREGLLGTVTSVKSANMKLALNHLNSLLDLANELLGANTL